MMNNLNDMLRQMGGGKKGNSCTLATYDFHETWTLTLTLRSGDAHLLITGKGAEPGDAAEDAYTQWARMTSALPEFCVMLPPPPLPTTEPPAFQEGDQFIQSPAQVSDDGIPF